jgi:hypothetical protein
MMEHTLHTCTVVKTEKIIAVFYNDVQISRLYILNSSGPEHGPVAGSCEHSNEPSGSTEHGEFLD